MALCFRISFFAALASLHPRRSFRLLLATRKGSQLEQFISNLSDTLYDTLSDICLTACLTHGAGSGRCWLLGRVRC